MNKDINNDAEVKHSSTVDVAETDAYDNVDNNKSNKNTELELQKIKQEYKDINDKYIRIYAEFDNFRKRLAKEQIDIINTASNKIIADLLPIIDDFERAIDNIDHNSSNTVNILDGVKLIYDKMKVILEKYGVVPIEVKKGDELNIDLHESITHMPIDDDSLKGKIIEVIQKGYMFINNKKVVRFAKVIIGS